MLPNTPFVTDSYHNVPRLNETKAFEYIMEGYRVLFKCPQEARIGFDTASKQVFL